MKHTPGPWTVEKWADKQMGKGISIRAVGGVHIANMVMQLDDTEPANARLIASALELLEACKEAIRMVENCPGNWVGGVGHMLRAAVARAEEKP